MKITILDPAMCCSTGVCGPDVDDALVDTAANAKWLKSLGHDVHRHNVSNDAEAFLDYPASVALLARTGLASLPHILVNNEVVRTGSYPSRSDWEQLVVAK